MDNVLPKPVDEKLKLTLTPDVKGSIVEDPREAAVEQLRIMEQERKKQERVGLVRKTVLISGAAMVGVVLLGAIVWFAIVVVVPMAGGDEGVDSGDSDNGDVSHELPVIEGYQCRTAGCEKIVELRNKRFLVKDGAYYVFDTRDESVKKTTIEEVSFRSVVAFAWGDNELLALERATGQAGLYSLTANRGLTGFSYDSFVTDPSDKRYVGMEWIVGRYILAEKAPEIRLLAVFDGAEIVRATGSVFVRGEFYFGTQDSGERRAYTVDGNRIVVAASGDFLAILDGYLIHVLVGQKKFDMYASDGTKLLATNAYYKILQDRLRNSVDYVTSVRGVAGVFVVP